MKLSTHFTLAELTRSQAAARQGIDNTPDDADLLKLQTLCVVGLEAVRALVKKPVFVSSGYRGVALNAAIRGSMSSQHCCKGEHAAADFEVWGIANIDLAEMIAASDIPFDQLILEYPKKNDPQAGWVHMSILTDGEKPRRQVLTALKRNGRTTYEMGLVSG